MILGLDVSTKTGAVVISNNGKSIYAKEWTTIDTTDYLERGYYQQRKLKRLLKEVDISFCVMENYAVRTFNAEIMITIGTMLRMVLREHEKPIYLCAPNTLKKFVTGKGSGKKDVMRLGVYKNWGFEHDSDNVVDAYALAKTGYVFATKKGNKNQLDTIQKIFQKKL